MCLWIVFFSQTQHRMYGGSSLYPCFSVKPSSRFITTAKWLKTLKTCIKYVKDLIFTCRSQYVNTWNGSISSVQNVLFISWGIEALTCNVWCDYETVIIKYWWPSWLKLCITARTLTPFSWIDGSWDVVILSHSKKTWPWSGSSLLKSSNFKYSTVKLFLLLHPHLCILTLILVQWFLLFQWAMSCQK